MLFRFFLFAGVASCNLVELWWNITYVITNPDGLHSRRAIGVNGSWPPPPVEVKSNDDLRIHVLNSLDVPTALHHHGMFMRGVSHLDGAVGVSQCGIPPGESFTYDVPISTSSQSGTFWIHGHYNGQAIDGLRTPFVIHPTEEKHVYDEEYVVLLSDWYFEEAPKMLHRFISKANPTGAEPVPQNGLIYFSKDGKYTSGFNNAASLHFEPGKTYRLRIINMAAFALFFFSIDGHELRIIEADSTAVSEYSVPYLSIAAAQRYSVLVTALDQPKGNYAIRAFQDLSMYDDIPEVFNPNTTSTIIYDPAEPFPLPPLEDIHEFEEFDDRVLLPIVKDDLPLPTRELVLEMLLETMDDGTNRGIINGTTWNAPLVPSILTSVSMGTDALNPAVYGPNTFILQYGEVLLVKVINYDDGSHPFHLHGHKFAVLYRADDHESSGSFSYPKNPLWRDTVQVPGGGEVWILFKADNPGAWMFHCHIEFHLEAGLGITFIEAPLQIQETHNIPAVIPNQCRKLGLPSTGNAAGRNSTDLTGLPTGPYRQILGWTPKAIAAIGSCALAACIGMVSVGLFSFS